MKALISLSILEYEPDLSKHIGNLAKSESLSKIIRLLQTGKIHRLHLDVMRPPMIPNTERFSIDLIKRIYEELNRKIPLAIHLMVKDPLPIVQQINGFIPEEERTKILIFIQRESYSSETDTVKALRLLKEYGYKNGICLDLPTPSHTITKKIVENADAVLLMSVPMGRGGQKYCEKATERIADFSRSFPEKTIEVDGGIDPQTIAKAAEAGAKIFVVGSFITRNENPEAAIRELEQSIGCLGKKC